LLVVKGKKHVSIQVKESRYYVRRVWKGSRGHSCHSLHEKKFLRDRKKVDFYVFLTYLPRFGEHRMEMFENEFVIIPTSELSKRIKDKKAGKRGIYFFCFNLLGDMQTGLCRSG